MGDDVVVVTSDDSGEEIADAVEEVIEVEQSKDLGYCIAKIESLESDLAECKGTVQLHDDLINLHSHDGLAESMALQETEERICARIDAITPPPVVEDITPELVEEPTEEETSSETSDEPPKSRSRKGLRETIASKYYGR